MSILLQGKFHESSDCHDLKYIGTDDVMLQLHHGAMMQHAGLAAHVAHTGAGMTHAAMPPAAPQFAASAMLASPTTAVTSASAAAAAAAHNNQPSNALFVSNLGPFCTEQELKDLFNR